MTKHFNLVLLLLLNVFAVTLFSQKSQAEFKGCHQYCGRIANDAWAKIHGNTPAPSSFTTPIFKQCMAATLAEGKTSDDDCNKVSSTTTVPTPTANPNRCVSEYTQLAQQCQSATSSAASTCDENTSSAFPKNAGTSETSTSGVSDSCEAANTLSSTAKDAWTTFKNSCESGMSTCDNACSAIGDWAKANASCFPLTVNGKTFNSLESLRSQEYGQNWDTCLALVSHVETAEQNISTYSNNATTASNCSSNTKGGDSKNSNGNLANQLIGAATSLLQRGETSAASTEAVKTFCETNPTYPGCGSGGALPNCSDPSMATNRVCICAANPAACRSAQADNSQVMASIDSSSRLPTSSDNLSGDIPDAPGIMPGTPSRGGAGEAVDGSQGGAPVGSANVGSGGPSSHSGSAVNDDPLATGGGGGTFGGSGGGSMFRNSGGAGGGGSSYGRAGNAANGGVNKPGTPDLRQFLPGGAYAPRGNAIGGKVGIDGITGPNSNIWQKVQNRYRVLQDTLHP